MSQRDPILHQLLRPIVLAAMFVPFFLVMVFYFWWDSQQNEMMTRKSLYTMAIYGGIVSVPWVMILIRLLTRISPVETPFEGPELPQCPHCGYDLRATPDRCPECGNTPRDSVESGQS